MRIELIHKAVLELKAIGESRPVTFDDIATRCKLCLFLVTISENLFCFYTSTYWLLQSGKRRLATKLRSNSKRSLCRLVRNSYCGRA